MVPAMKLVNKSSVVYYEKHKPTIYTVVLENNDETMIANGTTVETAPDIFIEMMEDMKNNTRKLFYINKNAIANLLRSKLGHQKRLELKI